MIDTRGAGIGRPLARFPRRWAMHHDASEARGETADTATGGCSCRPDRPPSRRRRAAARAVSSGSASIEALEAEARYARERYHLYRAKTYGPRPTSPARLRELERVLEGAEARLRRARQAQAAKTGD